MKKNLTQTVGRQNFVQYIRMYYVVCTKGIYSCGVNCKIPQIHGQWIHIIDGICSFEIITRSSSGVYLAQI